MNYTDDKVHHQECTIGNLFPEILSTIFEYLDVPAKGRVAQVIQTCKPFCQADMLFNLLWMSINGPYHFEWILGKKIQALIQTIRKMVFKTIKTIQYDKGNYKKLICYTI